VGEHSFRYDAGKKRLYLRISGFFREADAPPMWAELRQILEQVDPSFDVVADLRGFKPGSPTAARNIKEAAELIKQKGRRRGVRVAGKIVTGLMQFRREVQGMFDSESTRYASSLEEADQILDEWPAG
jgi:hypothetical protein